MMLWISSDGGPLVILPENRLLIWRGAAETGADYELACSVNDYAGLVEWKGCNALVLGDEPFQTTTRYSPQGVDLIRWMYAPDEETLLRALDTTDWGPPAEELEWHVDDADQVMIDSACEGQLSVERVKIRLPQGRQRVSTYVVKPSPEVAAVVHQISPA